MENNVAGNLTSLLDEFDRVEYGAVLPDSGILQYFYINFCDSGYIFAVSDEARTEAFFTGNDCDIESLSNTRYGWHIDTSEGIIWITLILFDDNGDQIPLRCILSSVNQGHMQLIRNIIAEKKLHIHFISLQYGNLYKTKTLEFDVPANIAAQLAGK